MKIKIDDLSILRRVYLSFAVLIGVLVAGSMLNYSSQNQLNAALVSVTEEASPIVLLANKLEVSLLSTNKSLRVDFHAKLSRDFHPKLSHPVVG